MCYQIYIRILHWCSLPSMWWLRGASSEAEVWPRSWWWSSLLRPGTAVQCWISVQPKVNPFSFRLRDSGWMHFHGAAFRLCEQVNKFENTPFTIYHLPKWTVWLKSLCPTWVYNTVYIKLAGNLNLFRESMHCYFWLFCVLTLAHKDLTMKIFLTLDRSPTSR